MKQQEEYNSVIASHYAAYRPPLHQLILKLCINNSEKFNSGLDVGCGTGYSAIALADYCRMVFGIEPGSSMLAQAVLHERVKYINSFGDDLPVKSNLIDVVTFAGSLFYAKSPQLINELKRVCRNGAAIIVYDFEIILVDILNQLNIKIPGEDSEYNPEINFSKDTQKGFREILTGSSIIKLNLSPSQLSHILLSSQERYNGIAEKYRVKNLFNSLVSELSSISKSYSLNAAIYYSRYSLINKAESKL